MCSIFLICGWSDGLSIGIRFRSDGPGRRRCDQLGGTEPERLRPPGCLGAIRRRPIGPQCGKYLPCEEIMVVDHDRVLPSIVGGPQGHNSRPKSFRGNQEFLIIFQRGSSRAKLPLGAVMSSQSESTSSVLIFELDREGAELRKGGKVVRIEPQVFTCSGILHPALESSLVWTTLSGTSGTTGSCRIVVSTRINAARRAIDDDGQSQRLSRPCRAAATTLSERRNSGSPAQYLKLVTNP